MTADERFFNALSSQSGIFSCCGIGNRQPSESYLLDERDNAEAILLLRSYYEKAGQWNMLKRMAASHLHLLAS